MDHAADPRPSDHQPGPAAGSAGPDDPGVLDDPGDPDETGDLVDERARDRVVVSGPDAGGYLQSQLSQEVRTLPVGGHTWTLVLEPTGKVHTLARLCHPSDDRYVLDTDAGFGDALAERLRRFMIRVDVHLDVVPAERPGPDAVVERRRVEQGWPRMGAEVVTGRTIPAATGVVGLAVDFAKGCYPGQELVERMDSRGSDAPQRLRVVDVDPGARVGDPILDGDGTEVGTLTSVADGVGLGYVRRGADVGRPPRHLAAD